MRLEALAGRRLALLGFGREGRAFEAAFESRRMAGRVTVLAESVPQRGPRQWPMEVAPLAETLGDFDLAVRSPGVPVNHPALAALRDRGGQVLNPSSIWFSERPEARVLAVTGSKGKSTTAALLAGLLQAAGLQVVLAGNIGVPLLGHLDTQADWFVLELSSYQLADLEGRVALGAITRLFPEHADWHGSVENYYRCKLRLAELLAGNPLLINASDPELVRATEGIAGRVEANRPPGVHARDDGIYEGEVRLLARRDLRLAGRHNLDNVALALACMSRLGLGSARWAGDAARFEGLPHRLERVATKGGVVWINDSIATTPHATLAALEAFGSSPIVLIAGGQERGGDWSAVCDRLVGRPLAGLVTLPDNGPTVAERLIEAEAVERGRVRPAANLAGAVAAAAELAPGGAVVLLSPGAPSFPHFRDFEDRGEQFRGRVAEAAGGSREAG